MSDLWSFNGNNYFSKLIKIFEKKKLSNFEHIYYFKNEFPKDFNFKKFKDDLMICRLIEENRGSDSYEFKKGLQEAIKKTVENGKPQYQLIKMYHSLYVACEDDKKLLDDTPALLTKNDEGEVIVLNADGIQI